MSTSTDSQPESFRALLAQCPLLYTTTCNVNEQAWSKRAREKLETEPAPSEPAQEAATPERQSYKDPDGCPTEAAVLKREWRRLTSELTAATLRAESADNLVAGIEAENDTLRAKLPMEEMERLKAEEAANKEAYEQLDGHCQRLADECTSLRSERDRALAHLAESEAKRKETAKDFEVAFRATRRENDQLRADLATAQRERQEAIDRMMALNAEAGTLRTQLAAAEARGAEDRAKITRLAEMLIRSKRHWASNEEAEQWAIEVDTTVAAMKADEKPALDTEL